MSDMLQLVVTRPTLTVVEIEGICLARHDKLKRLLQKGPTVLGAQASSPARVQRNQLGQRLLVRRDKGRRGRLRSQDRGAFLQEPIKHIGHCAV